LDGVIGGMDGGNVVFLGPDDGSRTFAVHPADDFAWAPSGDKLVVYDTGLWIVNADGTGRQLLTDDCVDGNPAWSPDGSKIAYNSCYGVSMIDADGTEKR
jgi:hypothetical protein